MILIITDTKSIPINRWVWELIPSNIGGSHTKIQGTAGRIPGNLVSGNQTCKQPPTGTVALRELQWRYVLNTIPPETPIPMMGGKSWVLSLQNQ